MQKNIIIDTESDAWFLRNKEALLLKSTFPHIDPLKKYIKKDEKVLEIGSSFGYNLNYLQKVLGCKGYGLEPSTMAVEFGKEKFPELDLKKGTIDQSNIFNTTFDHIIIGFCLYLVDVEQLPEVVYKIDSMLNKGGYLHIIDFDTKFPVEKSYSHDERIKIRKMDYSSLFCSFPNYFQAEKSSWSHLGEIFHADMNERCSTVTLFKEF